MKIGVIGATGYTGLALLHYLSGRPETEVSFVSSRGQAKQPLTAVHPSLNGFLPYKDLVLEDPEALFAWPKDRLPEVIFLAVSHLVSMGITPKLLGLGVKVIDLTGDFRLKDASLYPLWYKSPHLCPEFLPQAIYGLPELHRAEILKTSLVANPGCYATSVILALAPLLKHNLADLTQVIIADCKSGVSGAGKKALVDNLFSEVSENFRPYKVVGHQHIPEILQELNLIAGVNVKLSFTPHLVPMNRGILSTIYVRLKKEPQIAELQELYRQHYQEDRFVRVLRVGTIPQTLDTRGTNYCDLALFYDEMGGVLKIFSSIDNLARGAATQAIVNLNLISGNDEGLGIPLTAVRP